MLTRVPVVCCMQICEPAEYDFTDPELQQLWQDCCDSVMMQAKSDPDCEKPQWR